MAVIDIRTHYGMMERTAQAAKSVKHGSSAQISAISPRNYAKRFLEFLERIIVARVRPYFQSLPNDINLEP